MIATPHILIGAMIGAKIKKIGWVIILALLSHFILDRIPHWDYGNGILEKAFKNKKYKKIFIFSSKVFLDILIGLSIVFLIIWQKDKLEINYLIFVFIGICASVFPDFLTVIARLFPKMKLSKKYIKFHIEIMHSPKHIKKPTFLGVSTQVLVSLIAILILLL